MYIGIVLSNYKYSFSIGVSYVMRRILLIMWTAFQSFILRDNNNNNNNNNIVLYIQITRLFMLVTSSGNYMSVLSQLNHLF